MGVASGVESAVEWLARKAGGEVPKLKPSRAGERAAALERIRKETPRLDPAETRRGAPSSDFNPDQYAANQQAEAAFMDDYAEYRDTSPDALAPSTGIPDVGAPALFQAVEQKGASVPVELLDRMRWKLGDDAEEEIARRSREMARRGSPEYRAVADAAGIRRGSASIGIYEDDAFRLVADAAKDGGRSGRYVAGMPIDDVGEMMFLMGDTALREAAQSPSKPFKAGQPVTLIVEETGDNVLRLVGINGPAELAHRRAPTEIMDQELPVILQTKDGTPITKAPRLLQVEAPGGVLKNYVPPRSALFESERFADPFYPGWYSTQPKTTKDVFNAVRTLFSPEGQMVHGNFAAQTIMFAKELRKEDVWDTIQSLLRDPRHLDNIDTRPSLQERVVEGMDPYGRKGPEVIASETGGPAKLHKLFVEERAAEYLQEQRDFYSNLTGMDPVVLERMARFTYDSPYKLAMFGEKDPKLADLPIVWFHTDQEFFNLGITERLAQLEASGEMGIHIASSERQASHLTAGDAKAAAIRHFEAANHQWERDILSLVGLGKRLGMGEDVVRKIVKEAHDYGLRFDNMENEVRLNSMRETKVTRSVANWYNKLSFEARQLINKDELVLFTEELDIAIKTVDNSIRQTAQSSMILRGKKPLILWDETTFDPSNVAEKLLRMEEFAPYRQELEDIVDAGFTRGTFLGEALGGEMGYRVSGRDIRFKGNKVEVGETPHPDFVAFNQRTQQLREIIEDAGYDHILYPNAIEERGLPSAIVWREEHLKFTWAPFMSRNRKSMNFAALPALQLLDDKEKKK